MMAMSCSAVERKAVMVLAANFFDNILLERGVDRESLLLVFDEAMKAMRRYRKLQVLWMSSNICMDNSSILNLLPIDLCRSVAMFI